jgi:hypothetical protein
MLGQLRGRVGGAAGRRPLGGVLEPARSPLIRVLGAQCQVQGLLLGFVHQLSQQAMGLIALLGGGVGVDQRPEQRMAEPHQHAVALHDPGCERLVQATAGLFQQGGCGLCQCRRR